MRRVVVTGLGMVSPLGCGVEETWSRLLAGESGAARIEAFKVDDLACQIACQIPRGDGSEGTYNPNDWMEVKEQRKVDEFITFSMAAAAQALKDAEWEPDEYEDQIRTGVLIGSGIGGIRGIVEGGLLLEEKGPRRVSPFFIPGRLINLAAGYVSIQHNLKGPNHAVVTACSTGAHAIGDASRLIALGDAEVMVAGGTESPLNRVSVAGFAACRALSTNFNEAPTKASRPYDRDRDGFVMGEGAGVVVLEELEHAKARGAHIYGEIVGYGMSGDAYHITAPAEDGDGAYRCMTAALKRAGVSPDEIDYINAHGTSTPLGDEIELRAVERLTGQHAPGMTMSSTKSAIGHLLGAAGAVEAIFSILAIRDNVAPPTINLDNPSVNTPIDLVPHQPKEKPINVALSNSFGFGGTNASLVFRRFN
ncbi:beta-ketoacyl-ACP synthase II [Afifella sp. H1R]|uniref:beta-ketoacyl-ACP synthase II n=1 Tax=Afifella sp. H1R TaxID=2908841 RepID=UPI001F389DD7|nr:beta-ketoacyl-ACP synthase II [Afifella sp. H1R]MCF1503524.1 beta-ketoacyl-ACP synthase II [Afifella sp. H1R]